MLLDMEWMKLWKLSEKDWKKEDQIALARWEIPGEMRDAIVAPQICKECYNKLSHKYDMEKAIVPDDEKYFWCCGKFYIFCWDILFKR